MPKKKPKKVEIPVARPEPVDGDDREISMLWDKIMAHAPNPLAPGSHPNLYVTASAAIPSGPLTGATLVPVPPPGYGLWSQFVAPVALDSSPGARTRETLSPGAGSVASFTDKSAAKPSRQDQLIPASAIESKVAATSLGAAPPVVPIRHTDQSGRKVFRTLTQESRLLHAQSSEKQATTLTQDLVDAIANETKQLQALRLSLATDVSDLEHEKSEDDARHAALLVEQQQHFDTMRYRYEDAIQLLKDDRPRVEALLKHEAETKENIRERGERLTQMALDHARNVKDLEITLAQKKQKLATTMSNKMKRTTEDMASLTADQHQARRERAEQERARLTAELAAAERQSRVLAGRSRRLTAATDMLRRDLALESERRTFLSTKNASLARSLQQLVEELENLEKKFATNGDGNQTPRPHHVPSLPDDPSALAAIVDQQYEVILQLRHDLVAVRNEIAEAQSRLQKKQAAAINGSTSLSTSLVPASTALTITRPTEGGSVNPLDFVSLVRGVVLAAVVDIESAFTSAGRKLEAIDNSEKLQLLDYMIRRVNVHTLATAV